jgi:limonene-1,2-epoxide hydrolase
MTTSTTLDPTVARHITAVNNFDLDAVMATIADDALVNDNLREFWGADRVRAFFAREMVGDHVTLDVVDVVDNDGMWCVRCKYDGDYDKTGLPDPLIMTNYFRVKNDKIVTLFIVNNSDPQY